MYEHAVFCNRYTLVALYIRTCTESLKRQTLLQNSPTRVPANNKKKKAVRYPPWTEHWLPESLASQLDLQTDDGVGSSKLFCHSALSFIITFQHQGTFQGCPGEIGKAYYVQRFATGWPFWRPDLNGARFSAPIQIVLGAYPTSCKMGLFPRGKTARVWRLPPTAM
jgi:hypothetical protein